MFRNPATDLIIVLVIVLLIMGPKKLPGLGRGLGQGMREFKEGITGDHKDEDKPEITEGTSIPDVAHDHPAEPAATVRTGSESSASGSEHRS